jgi:hypothetical protein
MIAFFALAGEKRGKAPFPVTIVNAAHRPDVISRAQQIIRMSPRC